jgi:hypothetical protein
MAILALTAREAVAGVAVEQLGRHVQRVVQALEDVSTRWSADSSSGHRGPLRAVATEIFDVAETAWRLRTHWVAETNVRSWFDHIAPASVPEPFVRHLRSTQAEQSAESQRAPR